MTKAHVITWKSVVVEEWIVEGAANAAEAKELFKQGKGRNLSRSDFDEGNIQSVRVATEDEVASSDYIAAVSRPYEKPE